MNLVALPAFADNYIWLVHDGRKAVVVDPGDELPVLQALEHASLALCGILVTHHHPDHTGGVMALRERFAGVPLWTPATERLPVPGAADAAVHPVRGGDSIRTLGLEIEVIDTPGHTAGHLAYFTQPAGQAPVLFCGDTLFSAGCGRLFEGTAAQMHASLSRLATLPDATRICCAHEYTLSNLRFAAAVEPASTDVADHLRHCSRLREQGQPTLPTELAQERRINPFLRCDQPAVQRAAVAHAGPGTDPNDPVAVFAALRAWKNEFR